jgi:metal-responsive CopG/Arc/MetJ family transcriptional regulator
MLMTDKKSIRFNCKEAIVKELDSYKSRYVCRTQLIENALQHYLVMLKRHGVQQDNNWSGWLAK